MAEEVRGMARGPVDQYGCEATLDDIKKQLLNIYSEEGMGGAERAEPLMEKTYIIQRQYLNSVPAPAIAEIKEEWPFFTKRPLLPLWSADGRPSSLSCKRPWTTEELFGSAKNSVLDPGIEEILANFEPEVSDKAACILLLLMAYFKEPKNAIMLETNVSCLKGKKAGCDYTSRFTFTQRNCKHCWEWALWLSSLWSALSVFGQSESNSESNYDIA